MNTLPARITVALALAAAVAAPMAASAKPIEKGHFHDVWSETYDCEGTPVQADGDVSGSFLANQRGSSPFPYFHETAHGQIVTTNLETGGTFTERFATSSRDHKIVDNGDGTITITVVASGGYRVYDQHGRLVLKDPGSVWFAFDVDDNGTPGDPFDDVEVPDSFRIVKPSTGLNDTDGRNFCDDVRLFTS